MNRRERALYALTYAALTLVMLLLCGIVCGMYTGGDIGHIW